MGGIFSSGDTAAHTARVQSVQAANDEAARQAQITSGTNAINNTFGQFNDDFYNKQKQGYLDYATPQLQDQYADAQKQLTFSLDRSGLLDSSARSQKEAELQKLYDTNARSVADQGLSYENQAKSNVEASRANLISTLNSTGNADAAANSAINQAGSLSAAPAYSALGQLFSGFTGALGTQAALEKNAALYGGSAPLVSTGLFSPSKSAVQVSG
jgi:hypothetical protein